MNINRLLENAVRTDLIGHNMVSGGRDYEPDPSSARQTEASPYALHWDQPKPGLQGQLTLGHHLGVSDAVGFCMKDASSGVQLRWQPTRHRWTPAWTDTYYISQIEEKEYPDAGTLIIHEKKCILMDSDVFISQMKVTNLREVSRSIDVQIVSPFIPDEKDHARIKTVMLPGALGQTLYLSGHVVLCTNDEKQSIHCELEPYAETSFCVAFAFDPHSEEEAWKKVRAAFDLVDPFQTNEQAFNAWIHRYAPRLQCENIELLRLYYYRWFLIFKNAFTPADIVPEHFISTSCVYESCFGGWFGAPVGLSVPLQIMECAWMREGTLGREQIDQWVLGNGNYREYIQSTPYAAWLFFQHHSDTQWLESCYPEMLAYSLNKVKNGLPVTNGSWPTGAEYQPNFYQHTTPPWNWHEDVEGVREGFAKQPRQVYRLDEAVFAILNIRACLNMSMALNRTEDRDRLMEIEKDLLDELHNRHWNQQLQMYVSVDEKTGKQCDQTLCYDSFLTFLLGDALDNRSKTFDLLFSRKRFKEEFASSTVDKQCKMYWPGNCITGPYDASSQQPHFYPCCWNGPVWPYACTWITESLGETAIENPELRHKWVEYFESWSELHYLYGDRSVPCIVEHYRGADGKPFRAFNDYFHSAWLQPFFAYWVGLHKDQNQWAFDPFTTDDFEISNITLDGCEYAVGQKDGKRWMREVTGNGDQER